MSGSKDLTTGTVWAQLARLTGPMIVGIVAVLSISVADTYFVGQLGSNPLAALSFTFPVTMTLASLSIGLGAGTASVVSRAIGEKHAEKAKRLTTDSLVLAVIIVALASTAGYFTIRPLFGLLGAKGAVLDHVESYMRIWFISMPFLVIPMVANAVIRATGDALWPAVIMVGAAIINVILTPMLVFGWGSVPALGVEGAAWGTLISRALTLVLALSVVIFREKLVTAEVPSAAAFLASWSQVLRVGLPAAAANMLSPIAVGVVTAILAELGDEVVAAFGVATRIESFAAIPMLALSAAIGPVAGQNWGAGRRDRLHTALRLSYRASVVWSGIVAVALYFGASAIVAEFNDSERIRAEATQYLRIVPITLWGYGIIVVAAGAFNAIGRSVTGFGYYFLRSAALYAPLAWLAAHFAGSTEVYFGIALTNIIAGIGGGAYSLWWLKAHLDPRPK